MKKQVSRSLDELAGETRALEAILGQGFVRALTRKERRRILSAVHKPDLKPYFTKDELADFQRVTNGDNTKAVERAWGHLHNVRDRFLYLRQSRRRATANQRSFGLDPKRFDLSSPAPHFPHLHFLRLTRF